MKKLLIIVVLLLGMNTTKAQDKVQPFIGFAIDPKMAIEGPYKDKPNDIGTTFNGEFRGGVEFDNLRYTMQLEIHPAINYTKWTWISLDYRIDDFPLKRFGTYIGLESSVIYRTFSNTNPSDPYNYKSKTSTNALNPGVNLELQYRVYKNTFVSANINYFRAEEYLINYGKDFRWDVMIGAYIKLH